MSEPRIQLTYSFSRTLWRCENPGMTVLLTFLTLSGCRAPIVPIQGMDVNANVDHNHFTNELRGLLCRFCNLSADDAGRILGLAHYLQQRGSYDAPSPPRLLHLAGEANVRAITLKNPKTFKRVWRDPNDSNPYNTQIDGVDVFTVEDIPEWHPASKFGEK